MIGFNVPIYMKESIDCIKEAAESRKICGDGAFTKKCSEWMENKFNAHKVLNLFSIHSLHFLVNGWKINLMLIKY